MSVRLTNNIRGALLKKLIARAFKEKVQAQTRANADFVRRVYEDVFASSLKRMNDLPNGWLPTDTDIKVQMSGEVVRLYFWGTLDEYNPGEVFKLADFEYCRPNEYRFPSNAKSGVLGVYDGTHPLSTEFDRLRAQNAELQNTIWKAKKTAEAAMNAVGTVERLIKIWPEIEEFAKPYLKDGEQKALLPAIPRAELNAALHLPPEEKVE